MLKCLVFNVGLANITLDGYVKNCLQTILFPSWFVMLGTLTSVLAGRGGGGREGRGRESESYDRNYHERK